MGLKKFILDLLSFNTPQARVIDFSLIFLVAAITPVDKLHYLPVRSVFKTVFGIETYSTGLTRAMSSLFHGNFTAAWNFNKLVFPTAAIMLYLLTKNLIISIKIYKKTGKVI